MTITAAPTSASAGSGLVFAVPVIAAGIGCPVLLALSNTKGRRSFPRTTRSAHTRGKPGSWEQHLRPQPRLSPHRNYHPRCCGTGIRGPRLGAPTPAPASSINRCTLYR